MARYPKGSKVLTLTQGYYCIVSAVDYHYLTSLCRWYTHKSRGGVYARGTVSGRNIYLHRLLLLPYIHAGSTMQVDHIDRDTLNNMRENLRVVSPSTNQKNRRGWARAT